MVVRGMGRNLLIRIVVSTEVIEKGREGEGVVLCARLVGRTVRCYILHFF